MLGNATSTTTAGVGASNCHNANVDFCGIINLLSLLEKEGFGKVELKKIAARISAQIGADIILAVD